MQYLTKFEKVRVLGARATQISRGSPPTVDITGLTTAIAIARKEFNENKLPLVIIRKYPNGEKDEINLCE